MIEIFDGHILYAHFYLQISNFGYYIKNMGINYSTNTRSDIFAN